MDGLLKTLGFKAKTNTNTGSRQQVSPVRFIKSTKESDGTDSGWLRVRLDNSKSASLCERTKIQITNSKEGRTYFRIMDGSFKGKLASLTDGNAKLYLSGEKPTISSSGAVIEVIYSGKERTIYSVIRKDIRQIPARLSFTGNTATVSLTTIGADSLNPLPEGTYNILVPDVPHDKEYTEQYKPAYPALKCHQVWFPIEYQTNNRYVHVGAISEGCVTVLDLKLWNQIYDYLISHRRTDLRYVGKLIIRKI